MDDGGIAWVQRDSGVRMNDIDWADLLFSFKGRINRAKYWAVVGVEVVAGIAVSIVAGVASVTESRFVWAAAGLIIFVGYVFILWSSLAASIKRWHDRNKSGWWVLIGFVPIVGALWQLIETGFLEGTRGDNQYGPDPLDR